MARSHQVDISVLLGLAYCSGFLLGNLLVQ